MEYEVGLDVEDVETGRCDQRSERWFCRVLYIFYTSVGFHQRFDGVMVITFASHSVRERFRVRSSVESLFLLDVPFLRDTACFFCMICLSVLWIHRQSVSWHWLANLCRCEQKRCRDMFFSCCFGTLLGHEGRNSFAAFGDIFSLLCVVSNFFLCCN
jgi:hypothetical protein